MKLQRRSAGTEPPPAAPIEVREIEAGDRAWVRRFLLAQAGDTAVVSRGLLHRADRLPGLIARRGGDPLALLTYRVAGRELEVVTLHAARPGEGLGSSLLEAARERALGLGCRRLWLVTTNDNLPAIYFYARRGMSLRAIHRGVIRRSRQIKPGIPRRGIGGRPIEDEWEFEWRL